MSHFLEEFAVFLRSQHIVTRFHEKKSFGFLKSQSLQLAWKLAGGCWYLISSLFQSGEFMRIYKIKSRHTCVILFAALRLVIVCSWVHTVSVSIDELNQLCYTSTSRCPSGDPTVCVNVKTNFLKPDEQNMWTH